MKSASKQRRVLMRQSKLQDPERLAALGAFIAEKGIAEVGMKYADIEKVFWSYCAWAKETGRPPLARVELWRLFQFRSTYRQYWLYRSVRAFIKATCELGGGIDRHITTASLHQHYLCWVARNGDPEMTKQEFGRQLGKMGLAKGRVSKGSMVWLGLSLKQEAA